MMTIRFLCVARGPRSALSRSWLKENEHGNAPVRTVGRKARPQEPLAALSLHDNELEWLETAKKGLINEKVKIVTAMKFEKIEHSLPFYKLSIRALLSILKTGNNDERNKRCTNRLYYLANRLQCDPAILSLHLSKRTFIYTLSFDWLAKALDVLLEMGVAPERIMKDLWVIRYNPETIRKRLEGVKAAGREDLAPWMVRCPEHVLERSNEISRTEKNILAENPTTKAYLAQRLHTTPDVIEEMCTKIPAIQTMRVMKAKSCLDFLFAEGFTEEEIINVPRILAHSIKTIKARLDRLRGIGLQSRNLNVVCKSKRDFKKFFDTVQKNEHKLNRYIKSRDPESILESKLGGAYSVS